MIDSSVNDQTQSRGDTPAPQADMRPGQQEEVSSGPRSGHPLGTASCPRAPVPTGPAPANLRRMRRPRALWSVLACCVALAFSLVVTPTIGVAGISPGDVWQSILSQVGLASSPLTPLQDGIVWELRLPRVLTATLVGAGLAVCGAVLQALTRNPLADPYLLGLSSGASLGAVLVLVLQVPVVLPVAAFAGGMLALLLTLSIAGRTSPSRTVLAGVAVAAACGSVTSLVIFWSATGDSYREILAWLLGSLAGSDWSSVVLALTGCVVVGAPLLFSARTLDAYAFGETAAAGLGVRVERTRWLLLIGTALLTSALVAVSGAIGFIGLVLPHVVRLLLGPRHVTLLPLSAVLGGLLLLWADTFARFAFDPRELPVGILTAIIGAPVFALLLRIRTAR